MSAPVCEHPGCGQRAAGILIGGLNTCHDPNHISWAMNQAFAPVRAERREASATPPPAVSTEGEVLP